MTGYSGTLDRFPAGKHEMFEVQCSWGGGRTKPVSYDGIVGHGEVPLFPGLEIATLFHEEAFRDDTADLRTEGPKSASNRRKKNPLPKPPLSTLQADAW